MEIDRAITLNSDGTITVVASRVDTARIEKLIESLAFLRSQALPPVTLQPPVNQDPLVETYPGISLATKLNDDGTLGVGLRHGGYGWMRFHIDARAAFALRDRLRELFGIKEEPHLDPSGPSGAIH